MRNSESACLFTFIKVPVYFDIPRFLPIVPLLGFIAFPVTISSPL